MATSPAMYWAQQIAAAPVLAAIILLLSLLPARHVLMPFWPGRVDELVVLEADTQSATRSLSRSGDDADLPAGLLARTRPLSVVWVEHVQGGYTLGFPVGLESGAEPDADIREPLPAEFSAELLESIPDRAGSLVLLDANDRELSLPLSEIRRLYYPNRLSLAGRTRVLGARVRGCWMAACPPMGEAGHHSVTQAR